MTQEAKTTRKPYGWKNNDKKKSKRELLIKKIDEFFYVYFDDRSRKDAMRGPDEAYFFLMDRISMGNLKRGTMEHFYEALEMIRSWKLMVDNNL